jgi:hypothetical protein
MILPVPLNEAANAFSDGGLWSKACGGFQIGYVGIGGFDITWLHRQQIPLGSLAEGVFEAFYKVVQFDGSVVTDVIDPIGSIAMIGCP